MTIADIKVPEVGILDLCKCVTRSGRQALVRKVVRPFTKIENIAALAAEGCAIALNAGTDKLSDYRCNQIAKGSVAVRECCSLLQKSISPAGDGGKSVTDLEKTEIADTAAEGIRLLFTQTAVDAMVEKLVVKIP